MAVDGSLTFDTKINSDGFEKGKEKIVKEAEEINDEINRSSDKTVEVKADTSQARQSLDELQTEVGAVTDQPVEINVDPEPVSDATNEIIGYLDELPAEANNISKAVSNDVGSAAKSAEKEVGSSTSSIEDSLKKVQKGFKSLLAAAGIGLSVGTVVKYGKESVEAAAQVNAANSQLTQTFGDLKDNATDAMQRVADTSGIVETRFQGVGTSIYAFARTSGMGTADALGMMEDALQVAADSAAYYDRSLEDTSDTLMSFLKGNYANDAALGLSATETTRNAAANKLYGKSFQELSEAQKQLTLLQMVKDANALSGAEGQAAREADGWENVLGNLKESWRQLLAVVGQPILRVATSWVQQLTQALTYLTEKARTAMSALAELFGQEIGDTASATDNITESVSAQEDLTDAVEDTSKAESKSLAGFDKINTLTSGSAAGAGAAAGGSAAPATAAQKLKVGTSGANSSIARFAKDVRDVFGQIGGWIDTNFSPTFDNIWAGLSGETIELYGTMKDIFRDIQSLGPPLLAYFQGDFTTYLQTAFQTYGSIAVGLFDTFNTVFADIWNIAVFPMLSDFITLGLPVITQFCTESVLSLGTFFEEVKSIFDMLWEDAAKPVLTQIAVIWEDLMTAISDFWNTWGAPIFEAFRAAITNAGNALGNAWNKVFKPIFDKLAAVIDELWSKHLKPLVNNFLDFVGTLIEGALQIYNEFIVPIVNWFVNKFGPPIAKVFNWILDVVGKVIGNIIDFVSDIVTVLKGIVNFIVGVFTGDWDRAWDGVKQIFEGIWNAFVDIVKAPLNLIIGLINGFINAIENSLNWIIDCINTISVEVPDWVPVIGGSTFGFNLDHVDLDEVPYLAQGTVIPANYGNFLAMLGDNKRETEVVSPLSTMKKALADALRENGGNGPKEIVIYTYLFPNSSAFHREVVNIVNEDNARKGL
ncbi:MAG: hypothetical protein IJM44_01520 [Ruminococcus sp.]|nr:hypothetical protein [Ruminococcus sp.]